MVVSIPTQTLGVRPYDGVFDVWNFDYSIVNVFIHNAMGAEVTIAEEDMIGLPVVYNAGVAKLTAAASASTYNSVILKAGGDVTALANGASSTTIKCMLLIRGPAMIQDTMINLVDAAAAAITLATVQAALIANCVPPIITKATATNTISSPV